MGGLTPYPKYIQPIQFKWGGIVAFRATWGLSVVVGDFQESGIAADWGDGVHGCINQGNLVGSQNSSFWSGKWLILIACGFAIS